MISIDVVWLEAFLASVFYPAARVLGLFASAPLFGNRAISARIRLAIGLMVALAVVPGLPDTPANPPIGSANGLIALIFNMLVGIAIGFVIRLVFAAVDIAGELIGLQMSLSFALFFDP